MAERVIGLDIGTSAVRAAELLIGENGRPTLEAFGQVGLPPGAITAGEIRDRAQVVRALQRLWREGGFKERRVHVGIAGLRAITREIDMPALPPDELGSAVKFQADEVLPFSLEETELSSKVVAKFSDIHGADRLRVLVAAAHIELVRSIVSVVEEAGLEPVAVDLHTDALARALYNPAFGGGPEAIVSVGAGLTLVVLHEQGVVQFVRTIDLGGESITDSIASALDLPHADAERIKRGLGSGRAFDPRAGSAAEQAMDELIGEIRNSIRFYSSLPGRQPVAHVLVTGAGARITGFLPRLRDATGIPVSAASPLMKLDTAQLPISEEEASEVEPVLAVPVGLAMPDPTGHPFNLLPPEVAARAAEARIRRSVFTAVAGLAVILIALTVWRVLAIHSAENAISALNTQNNVIRTVEIPKYDKALALKDHVEGQARQVQPLLDNEVDWLVVFNQISQYIPSSATLSSIDLTSNVSPGGQPTSSTPITHYDNGLPTSDAVIGTISTAVTTSSLQDVTAWGQQMAQSPVLANVDLSGGITNGNSVSFAATLSITGNAHSQRLGDFSVPNR